MASHPRMTLPIIAAAGIAAMLSATAPAFAESTVAAGKAAAVKTERVVVKPRAARRSPFVATQARQDRRVSPACRYLGCSDVWYGRQFVLMVGIGF
jgi:hypothetical protein